MTEQMKLNQYTALRNNWDVVQNLVGAVVVRVGARNRKQMTCKLCTFFVVLNLEGAVVFHVGTRNNKRLKCCN
jgi:hypothetical protein